VLQARWTAPGVELVDVEPPPLREGWVRLQVAACGICGSDLHVYRGGLASEPGGVPGHEVVGFPVEGATGLDARLYAVEPRTWCGACELCVQGRRHLCPQGGLFGVTGPGGLAEFMDVPVTSLHPVSPTVSPVVAAIAEPLAVSLRAVRLAGPTAGSRVLVLGGGAVGLLTGLLARDRSSEVGVTARHPHQQEAARKLGLVPLGENEAESWARDREPDTVIETVGGAADTLDQAVRLCRAAGRIVVLGLFTGTRSIDAFLLMVKELTVMGSNTYGTDRSGAEFGAAVDLIPRYRHEIGILQTHRLPLTALEEAFRLASDKASGAIKVTLVPVRNG
jgi:threonine dehydrogenase-like Zn-dependent dehydrogenase